MKIIFSIIGIRFHNKNDNYTIANVKYSKLDRYNNTQKDKLETVVKGKIPYIGTYFKFLVTCEKKNDKYGEYHKINQVLNIQRAPQLTFDILLSALDKEMNYSDQQINVILDHITRDNTLLYLKKGTDIIEENWIPMKMLNIFKNNIDFFKYDIIEGTLLKLFPKDNYMLSRLGYDKIRNLHLDFSKKPYLLYFGKYTKLRYPNFITSSCDIVNILDLYGNFKKEKKLAIEAKHIYAIELYRLLKNKVKNSGSISFRYNDLFYLYKNMDCSHFKSKIEKHYNNNQEKKEFIINLIDNNQLEVSFADILSLLIDEIGVVFKYKITSEDEIFTLEKDYFFDQIIYNTFNKIFKKHYFLKGKKKIKINRKYNEEEEKGLNDLQKKCIQQVAKLPILNVIGLPGIGKTKVIECLYKKYKHTKVVSFCASMVCSLKERGITNAETIHSVITRRDLALKKTFGYLSTTDYERFFMNSNISVSNKSDRDDDDDDNNNYFIDTFLFDLSKIEILIIDEATNIHNELMAKLFQCFHRLSKIVFVYDPEQISPIKQGELAIQLKTNLNKRYIIELKKQYRFDNSNEKSVLLSNDRKILSYDFDHLKYQTFKLNNENCKKEGLFNNSPSGWYFINYNDYCIKNLSWKKSIETEFFYFIKAAPYFMVPETSKILCLTNNVRRLINKFLEKRKNPNYQKIKFYKGQPITATKNFKEQHIVIKQPPLKKKEKPKKNIILISHKISNGEIYIFDYYQDFDVKTRKWVPIVNHQDDNNNNNFLLKDEIYPKDYTRYKRFIYTKCGKQLCLNQNYIPHEYIQTAWAITVNKSQGREYENICFILPKSNEYIHDDFNIKHAHVALTRAKKRVFILGNIDLLKHLCTNPMNERFNTIGYRIYKNILSLKNKKKTSVNINYHTTKCKLNRKSIYLFNKLADRYPEFNKVPDKMYKNIFFHNHKVKLSNELRYINHNMLEKELFKIVYEKLQNGFLPEKDEDYIELMNIIMKRSDMMEIVEENDNKSEEEEEENKYSDNDFIEYLPDNGSDEEHFKKHGEIVLSDYKHQDQNISGSDDESSDSDYISK